MYTKPKINPENFVDVTAWSFLDIAFNETAEKDKVNSLAILFYRMTAEQRKEFRELIGNWDADNDNDLFNYLIKIHNCDEVFDYPECWKPYQAEEWKWVIPICNAFNELCGIRGPEWTETHDWEFDNDGTEFDVGIIEL